MAFFRNDAVNRVNVHSAIQAFAQAGGGVFVLVFFLRAGLSVPAVLLAIAALLSLRFALRPVILPLAKRWGLKPLLIVGTFVLATTYPLVATVQGIGIPLVAFCLVAAIGDIFYWPVYNAYFASVGDAEHRGHQIGAREALVAVAGILAPLLGTWALIALGPHPMFAAFGVVQALAVVPLIGAPNVMVKPVAPGAFRAAWLGAILSASDGWFDASFIFVWQIGLFLSLNQEYSAYGGAMALAGLVGAAFGMFLGRHIDFGHGVRAVFLCYSILAGVVLLRSVSLDLPWLAVIANAPGALLGPLLLPASTAFYNLAKASPCPMRFHMATEGGWDLGCTTACILAAGLITAGVSLPVVMLLALPPLGLVSLLLRRYYAGRAMAMA